VAAAIEPYIREAYGNPSNLHSYGRECAEGLAEAREQVAAFIGADVEEVFFTGSGTESDNWAVKGVACAVGPGKHIVTSPIEHGAVLGACRYMGELGWKVSLLLVDGYGRVDPEAVRRALTDSTALVSVMLVNNEIGTIEPVRKIAAICHERGVLCHTDAVAAVGKIEVAVDDLGVDLLTISGHKLHAPKGIGVLYVRRGTEIHPFIHGGHQERGMRAGTENVIGAVGMGKACELLRNEWREDAARMKQLRDRLERGIVERIAEIQVSGHPENRVCNVLHVTVGYIEGEALLLSLDLEGVAVASGSACSAGEGDASATVEAIGISPLFRNSPVRFSLGRDTTEEEIDRTIDVFEQVVGRLRDISPLWTNRSG